MRMIRGSSPSGRPPSRRISGRSFPCRFPREAELCGHLGGSRRAGLQNASGAWDCRDYFRRDLLDEDFRDRKVADEWFVAEIQAETRDEGFRRHNQIPFRSEIRYRGAPSASIMPRWAAASWPSTTGPSTGPRRSASSSTNNSSLATTSSSSTRRRSDTSSRPPAANPVRPSARR